MSSYVKESSEKATTLMQSVEEKKLHSTKITRGKQKFVNTKLEGKRTKKTKELKVNISSGESLKESNKLKRRIQNSLDIETVVEPKHTTMIPQIMITDCEGVTTEYVHDDPVAETSSSNDVIVEVEPKYSTIIPQIMITDCKGVTTEYVHDDPVAETSSSNDVIVEVEPKYSTIIPQIMITDCEGVTTEYVHDDSVAETSSSNDVIVEVEPKYTTIIPLIMITDCEGVTTEYVHDNPVGETSSSNDVIVEVEPKYSTIIPLIMITDCEGVTTEYLHADPVAETSSSNDVIVEVEPKYSTIIPQIMITDCEGVTTEYVHDDPVVETSSSIEGIVEVEPKHSTIIPQIMVTNCEGVTTEYVHDDPVVETSSSNDVIVEVEPKHSTIIPQIMVTNCEGVTTEYKEQNESLVTERNIFSKISVFEPKENENKPVRKYSETEASVVEIKENKLVGNSNKTKKKIDKSCKQHDKKETKFEISLTWMNEHKIESDAKSEDNFNEMLNNYLSRIPSTFAETSIVSSEIMATVLNNNRIEGCPSQKVIKDRSRFENEANKSLTRRYPLWKSLTNFVTSRQTNITVGHVDQSLLFSNEVSKHSMEDEQSKSWRKILIRKQRNNVKGESVDEVRINDIINFILKKSRKKNNLHKDLTNGVRNYFQMMEYLNDKEGEIKIKLQQRWRIIGKTKLRDQLEYLTESINYLKQLHIYTHLV